MSENAEWIIDLREQQLRDLRAQLAAVTADRDALALELKHLRPEWEAMQAERDAAVSALRLATDATPGKGTGVWVPLDKWQELQAQLAAVPMDVLRRWFEEAYVEYSDHYSREQANSDYDTIESWLQPRE